MEVFSADLRALTVSLWRRCKMEHFPDLLSGRLNSFPQCSLWDQHSEIQALDDWGWPEARDRGCYFKEDIYRSLLYIVSIKGEDRNGETTLSVHSLTLDVLVSFLTPVFLSNYTSNPSAIPVESIFKVISRIWPLLTTSLVSSLEENRYHPSNWPLPSTPMVCSSTKKSEWLF